MIWHVLISRERRHPKSPLGACKILLMVLEIFLRPDATLVEANIGCSTRLHMKSALMHVYSKVLFANPEECARALSSSQERQVMYVLLLEELCPARSGFIVMMNRSVVETEQNEMKVHRGNS